MIKKSLDLNNVCPDLECLTGISFRFIPLGKESDTPFFHKKKFCIAKDFHAQRKLCIKAFQARINNPKNTRSFNIITFKCGLSQVFFPVYHNGNLKGIVLSSVIGEGRDGNSSNSSRKPHLHPKQLSSLIAVLNSYHSLFRERINTHPIFTPETKDQILVGKARAYIDTNYHNSKIPLKELAGEVGTSHFYLCRIFKKELDINFVTYLNKVRLETALKLLENLKLTVFQVAYAVGFSDAQYFDRVFKKYLNCTPKAYRFGPISKKEKIRQKLYQLM